jgi:MFS family permease
LLEQHSFLAGLSILIDIPFLLLIPTMCYNGLSQGFIFAAIPPLIVDKSRKFLLFALFGLVNAISSFIFGKLSDILGRRLLIFAIGVLTHMIIFILLLIIWKPPLDEARIDIFITMVICFSIGDAIFTNQLYSIIAMFYGKTRPADAFACLKVFQAGCIGIAFVGHVYLSFHKQVLCLIILLSLTTITLIYEHYGVTSLDTAKMVVSKENKNGLETTVDTQVPLATLSNTA